MRDLALFVPCDCTASNTEEINALALAQMQQVLKADIRVSTEIELDALLQRPPAPPSKSNTRSQ